MSKNRVYLDWNATAPLRPEARAAMLEAMDAAGNPSSVHAEGRAAKAIVERARGQVADLIGCDRDEVAFTSGATEAASLVILGRGWWVIALNDVEHDAVDAAARRSGAEVLLFHEIMTAERAPKLSFHGRVERDEGHYKRRFWESYQPRLVCLQEANSETGIRWALPGNAVQMIDSNEGQLLRDVTHPSRPDSSRPL